ncbi:MAG: hypothetical protein JNL01_03340 [Bdellovibrionales bacterium]|nr:hypothetical protein [Bdellovibrionales bacterium]
MQNAETVVFKKPSLTDLTRIQGVALANTLRKESLPFSRIDGGLEKGKITEWIGPLGCGKSELVLQFLNENPETRCAWIEEKFTALPSSFSKQGTDLNRFLFIETGPETPNNLGWAAAQVLRSGIFQVIVLHSNRVSSIDLRRIQLLAEKAQACVLVLREAPVAQSRAQDWMIQQSWKVSRLFSIPQLYRHHTGASAFRLARDKASSASRFARDAGRA